MTGIAWEVGLLAGLSAAGVDLAEADAVIGTSAGAFVGAALASGHEMERMFATQSEPADTERAAAASEKIQAAWYDAFATGGEDRQKVGAAFGRIGKAYPEPVPRAVRRAVVQARLVTTQWPASLRVTAIDADTGELHVFDPTLACRLSMRCQPAVPCPGSGRSSASTAGYGWTVAWCPRRTPGSPKAMSGWW